MELLSISKIKTFKSCRRLYELKYIEGVVADHKSDALEIGSSYHENIENLYLKGDIETRRTKADAMAIAYNEYIKPDLYSLDVEKWVEYPLNERYKLIGRIDGMTDNGIIVEHKTTSLNLEEYEYNLQWDEQSLAYMLCTGCRKTLFTVIRKPTIRQRKSESDDEFFERMVQWYDTDTAQKIGMILIERSDAEVKEFEKELLRMSEEMNTDNLYRNTSHCRCWGRMCEYAPICLEYNPEKDYFGFTKRRLNENKKIE